MRTIYNSEKIIRLETHRIKQQTRHQTRHFGDKTRKELGIEDKETQSSIPEKAKLHEFF